MATATKTLKATSPSPMIKTVKSRAPHPAHQAGAKIHDALETGVTTLGSAVGTGATYAYNFLKGLVKG